MFSKISLKYLSTILRSVNIFSITVCLIFSFLEPKNNTSAIGVACVKKIKLRFSLANIQTSVFKENVRLNGRATKNIQLSVIL